jgi:hypothetical protein
LGAGCRQIAGYEPALSVDMTDTERRRDATAPRDGVGDGRDAGPSDSDPVNDAAGLDAAGLDAGSLDAGASDALADAKPAADANCVSASLDR